MKTIIKISAYILAAGLLWLTTPRCTDLDEDVYDQIPSDEFMKDQQQIDANMAMIYKAFGSYWPESGLNLNETSGDGCITPTRRGGDWWDGGAHMQLYMQIWDYNNAQIKNGYDKITNAISICNQIYNTISLSDKIAEADKEKYYCEIRGVRAYWYYMYVDLFGNGPLVKDFSGVVPDTRPRRELYDFAVAELLAVKDKLTSAVTTATYGHFTKGAAYALLAKLYLNSDAWGFGARWNDVIVACDTIMQLNQGKAYMLEPEWKTNFGVMNEVSRECIWAHPFSKSEPNNNNNIYTSTLHYKDPIALGITLGPNNGISACPSYVQEFDPADKRIAWTYLTGPMLDPATGQVLYTAHDRPLIHTVEMPVIAGSERMGTNWGDVEQEVGARCIKWTLDPSLSNTASDNDFAIFRLADVYLMKAEALVRLNQDVAEATRLVNEIRARAFDNPAQQKPSVTLDDIYHERRFELAWEMYNRQDMIRFGTFLAPKPYLKDNVSEDYKLLFPIPLTALAANSKLQQNPGYPK